METKQKIDSFLRESLTDKDNLQNIVPQNIENKIFQQFRNTNGHQKAPLWSFISLQRIAVMLFLFLGGTFTGWWLRNPPKSKKEPVFVNQIKIDNPINSHENHEIERKTENKQLENMKPTIVDTKSDQKSVKSSNVLSQTNSKNDITQMVENQNELPSIMDLSDLGYSKLRFPSENLELAKSENQRIREIIQNFKFVSL